MILEREKRKVTNFWGDSFVELDNYILIDKDEIGINLEQLRVGSKLVELTYQKPDGTIEVEYILQDN